MPLIPGLELTDDQRDAIWTGDWRGWIPCAYGLKAISRYDYNPSTRETFIHIERNSHATNSRTRAN